MFLFVLLIFFSLLLKGGHLLSVLINLEFLGLLFFCFFIYFFLKGELGLNVVMSFLMAMGCESIVGLVLFVLNTQLYSKDYFLNSGLFSF